MPTSSQQTSKTTRHRDLEPGRLTETARAEQRTAPRLPAAALLQDQEAAQPLRLIPIERVCEILGLKKSAVHAKVADGTLPAQLKFGANRRAAARWIEHEILEFVWTLAAQRPQAAQSASSAANGPGVDTMTGGAL